MAYGVGKTTTLAHWLAPIVAGKPPYPWVITAARRTKIAQTFPSPSEEGPGPIVLLPSCSRPYWDITTHWNSMTMEELVLFWCTLAPIVFSKAWSDDDSDEYYKLVNHLSKAFRMVFNFNCDVADTRLAADYLHQFGVLAETCTKANFQRRRSLTTSW